MKLLQNNDIENPNALNVPQTDTIMPNTSNDTSDEQSIIQKLLQEKQVVNKKETKLSKLKDGKGRSMSAHEVASMRYKIFSLVCLLLSVVLWVWFVQPALNTYHTTKQSLLDARKNTELDTIAYAEALYLNTFASSINEISDYDEDKQSYGPLIACINKDESCEDLIKRTIPSDDQGNPVLKWSIDDLRKQAQYYLQIGDLTDPKLLIDEKSLLTNIDLFLLRYGPNNTFKRNDIGEINAITISDPTHEQDDIYSATVELVINFPSDTSLINFLKNTENRIIENKEIWLPPILYKVEQVEYDIANYDSSQETIIKLIAYYYAGNQQ